MFKKKAAREDLSEQQQDLVRLLMGTVTQAESIFEVMDKTTKDEEVKHNLKMSYLTLMAHTLNIRNKMVEIIFSDIIKGAK